MTDKDKKVVSLQQNREKELEQGEEIANLLTTIRKARETVPVNHQLKNRLREQLLNQKNMQNGSELGKIKAMYKTEIQQEAGRKEKRVQLVNWLLFLVPLVAIIGGMFWWLAGADTQDGQQGFYREERQIFYDNLGSGGFSAVISSQEKIFFVHRGSIWRVDSGGQNRAEILAPQPGKVFQQIELTPTEEELIVVAISSEGSELLLVRLSDLHKEQLSSSRPGEELGEPALSPEGSHLAYTKVRENEIGEVERAIYMLNLSADEAESELVAYGSHPSWSPDGRQLAFERVNSDGVSEIWLVNRDGAGEAFWGLGGQPHWSMKDQLTFVQERRWEKTLSYSSDGEPLLITEQVVQEVWVADLEGQVRAKLTNLPGPTGEEEANLLRQIELSGEQTPVVVELKAKKADYHPHWSPDGSFIVLERNDEHYSTMLWVKVGGLQ